MDTSEDYLAPANEPGIIINTQAHHYLSKAGKWATFLGIIGFIMTGLIALGALTIGTLFTTMSQFSPMGPLPAVAGTAITIVYLLLAVLSFFFAYYLYTFGSKISKGLLYNSSEEVTLAFGRLKSLFKLWGITIIVIISFYVLIFALVIIGGLGSTLMHR